MYYNHNDYELIYLINEGVEGAFNELVNKYTYLLKKIHRSRHVTIPIYDFIQEGLMILNTCLKTYDIEGAISFYVYFNICLHRRLHKISMINKRIEGINYEANTIIDKNSYSYKSKMIIKELSFEDSSMRDYFNNYIIRGMSLKRYCQLTNKSYEKEYYKYKKIIKELRKKVD